MKIETRDDYVLVVCAVQAMQAAIHKRATDAYEQVRCCAPENPTIDALMREIAAFDDRCVAEVQARLAAKQEGSE